MVTYIFFLELIPALPTITNKNNWENTCKRKEGNKKRKRVGKGKNDKKKKKAEYGIPEGIVQETKGNKSTTRMITEWMR